MEMKYAINAILVVILGLAFNAQANMIGDTITGSGSSLQPATAIIGTGIEFDAHSGSMQFDFAENLLTVSVSNLFAWGGYGDYIFSEFDDVITSVSLVSNTFLSGFTNFSFDDHSITLDADSGERDLEIPTAIATFAIETRTNVPEPSTLILMGLGIIGVGAARMRKAAA
jgi:hypothetical protein